jgi:hypothetical protein
MAVARLERLGTLEKSSDLIGIRTRYRPACGIVPQQHAQLRASINALSSIM